MSTEIVGMAWDDWLEYLQPRWRPGQHMALCAPTEAAKTTAVCSMLNACRSWTMAFDAKGGDSVLKTAGFRRISKWDRNTGRRILASLAPDDAHPRGKPAHLTIGPEIARRADRPRLISVMEAALEWAFEVGRWTTYFDELQLMYDRRMANLSAMIDEMLISARDPKRLTVVSTFQAPANVSRRASDMAWWFGVGRTRDTDVVNRLGEMAGRSRAEMRGIVSALPKFHLAFFSRDLDDPIVLTRTRPLRPPARGPAPAAPVRTEGWRRVVWGAPEAA